MTTTSTVRPPIPAVLADRETVGGLVIPWLNVRLADGGVDFRNQHTARARRCWLEQLCQLCGDPIPGVMVLIGGPSALAERTFHEPPLHPVCAAYVSQACPMLAGRLTHFATGPSLSQGHRGKTCSEPGCDCAGWVPSDPDAKTRAGEPAHPWFAVWADDYALAVLPSGQLYGGRLVGEPRKVRQISTPAGAA